MRKKVTARRPELLEALIDGDSVRVDRMLSEGTDPNVRDSAGWTALHFAAERQDAALIERLLATGAEVDVADEFGNTPLWRAVFTYRNGSAEPIRALLAAGADRHRPNTNSVSPMTLAETIANYDARAILRD